MNLSRRGYTQLAALILTGGLTMSSAFAFGPVVARVTDAGTNSDGSAYVIFDRPVVNCDKKDLNRFG